MPINKIHNNENKKWFTNPCRPKGGKKKEICICDEWDLKWLSLPVEFSAGVSQHSCIDFTRSRLIYISRGSGTSGLTLELPGLSLIVLYERICILYMFLLHLFQHIGFKHNPLHPLSIFLSQVQ